MWRKLGRVLASVHSKCILDKAAQVLLAVRSNRILDDEGVKVVVTGLYPCSLIEQELGCSHFVIIWGACTGKPCHRELFPGVGTVYRLLYGLYSSSPSGQCGDPGVSKEARNGPRGCGPYRITSQVVDLIRCAWMAFPFPRRGCPPGMALSCGRRGLRPAP